MTTSAAMQSTMPIRRILIQPCLPASQPESGAANTPISAGGARNRSAEVAASRPKPTFESWLSSTTVKLITAKTPDRVRMVVAITGHTWRERRCSMAISGVTRFFSTNQKATSETTVPAR